MGSERVIPPVLRLHGYWCDERRDGMATNLQCRDALAGERRWKLGTCFFGTTRPSQLQGWHGRITAPIRSPAIGCPTPRPACNTSSWAERGGLYQHKGVRGTGSPAWVLAAAGGCRGPRRHSLCLLRRAASSRSLAVRHRHHHIWMHPICPCTWTRSYLLWTSIPIPS